MMLWICPVRGSDDWWTVVEGESLDTALPNLGGNTIGVCPSRKTAERVRDALRVAARSGDFEK